MKKLILLIVVILINSCSEDRPIEPRSVITRLDPKFLAVANGGVIIGAISGTKFTSRTFEDPASIPSTISLTLPAQGLNWRFFAIGWTGANHFEGNTLCATQIVPLTNGANVDITLNLDANPTACVQSGLISSAAALDTAGNIAPSTFVMCSSLPSGLSADQNCHEVILNGQTIEDHMFNAGITSFKFVMKAKSNLSNNSVSGSITSACQTNTNIFSSSIDTNLRIPLLGAATAIFDYDLELYFDETSGNENCDTSDDSDAEHITLSYTSGLINTFKHKHYTGRTGDRNAHFIAANFIDAGVNALSSLTPRITCSNSSHPKCLDYRLGGTSADTNNDGRTDLSEQTGPVDQYARVNYFQLAGSPDGRGIYQTNEFDYSALGEIRDSFAFDLGPILSQLGLSCLTIPNGTYTFTVNNKTLDLVVKSPTKTPPATYTLPTATTYDKRFEFWFTEDSDPQEYEGAYEINCSVKTGYSHNFDDSSSSASVSYDECYYFAPSALTAAKPARVECAKINHNDSDSNGTIDDYFYSFSKTVVTDTDDGEVLNIYSNQWYKTGGTPGTGAFIGTLIDDHTNSKLYMGYASHSPSDTATTSAIDGSISGCSVSTCGSPTVGVMEIYDASTNDVGAVAKESVVISALSNINQDFYPILSSSAYVSPNWIKPQAVNSSYELPGCNTADNMACDMTPVPSNPIMLNRTEVDAPKSFKKAIISRFKNKRYNRLRKDKAKLHKQFGQ